MTVLCWHCISLVNRTSFYNHKLVRPSLPLLRVHWDVWFTPTIEHRSQIMKAPIVASSWLSWMSMLMTCDGSPIPLLRLSSSWQPQNRVRLPQDTPHTNQHSPDYWSNYNLMLFLAIKYTVMMVPVGFNANKTIVYKQKWFTTGLPMGHRSYANQFDMAAFLPDLSHVINSLPTYLKKINLSHAGFTGTHI